MRRLWFAVPAVLLLAACGRETAPSPPESTTSPDTTAAPPAALDTASWTIRADGIGPLRVGMTSEEASQALGQTVVPDTSFTGPSCAYASARLPTGDTLAVMFSDGRVVRVEPAFQQNLRSADGFGAGSTEADVRARYPNLRAEGHAYVTGGKYLVTHPLPDTTLQIVYETDEQGVVTDLRGGRDPFVGYVEGCS